VRKVLEGRPHILDAMKNREIQLVFNTTEGAQSLQDSFSLRRSALMMKIPYFTTAAGALAAAQAIAAQAQGPLEVRSLQSYAAGDG
jgi:carbamoyl-phosphate synthase large subunit